MVIQGRFLGGIRRTIWLEFIRAYWGHATEDFEGAEAMALGYHGA